MAINFFSTKKEDASHELRSPLFIPAPKPEELQNEFITLLEKMIWTSSEVSLLENLTGDRPLRAAAGLVYKVCAKVDEWPQREQEFLQFLEANIQHLNFWAPGSKEHKTIFHYLIHIAYNLRPAFKIPESILLLPNLPWDVPYGEDFAKKWGIYHGKQNLENATPLWMLTQILLFNPSFNKHKLPFNTLTQIIAMQKLNFFAKPQGRTILQQLCNLEREYCKEDDAYYYPVEYLLLKCSQHLELDRIYAQLSLPKEQEARHHFAYWLAKAEFALAQPKASGEEKKADDPFSICMAKADSFRLQAIENRLFNADYLMTQLFIKKIQKNRTASDLDNYMKNIFSMSYICTQYHAARGRLAQELIEPNSIFKNHLSEAVRQQKAYELMLESAPRLSNAKEPNDTLETVKTIAGHRVTRSPSPVLCDVDTADEAQRLLVVPEKLTREIAIDYLIKYKKAYGRIQELQAQVEKLKLSGAPSV